MVELRNQERVLRNEDEVIRLISSEVADRRLGPGSRLPTERELATLTHQSRSTVRRALASLEAQGQIVRHVGRGTFIASSPDGPIAELSPVHPASPGEIMAVRLLLEPQLMPLVVTAATPVDFLEMRRCLDGGERARDYEEFEQWDAAFHRSLAQATHNGLLTRMLDMTNDARQQPLWQKLKRRSHTPERRRAYMQDHREIFEALVEVNRADAQEAMRRHLLRVRTNILGEEVY